MNYVRMDEAANDTATENAPAETPDSNTTTDNTTETTEKQTGVVKDADALRVRSGPGTNNAQVGVLTRGTTVVIHETTMVAGVKWGRIDSGWICMNYVGSPEEPAGTMGTIRADSLRIRSGPGTNYSVVGSYNQGTQVEILETKMVGSTPWGRTNQGWISLAYVKQ